MTSRTTNAGVAIAAPALLLRAVRQPYPHTCRRRTACLAHWEGSYSLSVPLPLRPHRDTRSLQDVQNRGPPNHPLFCYVPARLPGLVRCHHISAELGSDPMSLTRRRDELRRSIGRIEMWLPVNQLYVRNEPTEGHQICRASAVSAAYSLPAPAPSATNARRTTLGRSRTARRAAPVSCRCDTTRPR